MNGNTFMSGLSNSDSVCVPSGTCLKFQINDSYGDGICCTQGNGSYTVYINGVFAVTGGEYEHVETRFLNCPPGSNCDNPFAASTDSVFSVTGPSQWYAFTPDSTGVYNISTCFPSNTCNTRIWVYDHCASLQFDSLQAGTLFYNDTACGNNAFVNAGLQANVTYYIRVGGDASCTDSIVEWEMTYGGPIVGCTDSTACNYNPLATISNGTCVYPGDPNCTSGPDLSVNQSLILNSLSLGNTNGNDVCLIGEGCLSGYGMRQIINFSTQISNIGDADYYIGPPQVGNSQFVYDQCHGHWHYAGYAQYELYDAAHNPMQAGFKNGFCVLDLMCFTGTAKFGCSNMGITAGCADEYGAGLQCQWIDVTDIPAGQYTLVVKVNWDHSPDKLGRVEKRFDNNNAAVCFTLSRSAQNVPSISNISANCAPIIDCLGDTFGLAMADCDGVCNGPRLSGDLNTDTVQNSNDLLLYMDDIVNTAAAVTCNDLNGDGTLDITDASLLSACINFTNGSHTHPGGTQNTHRHCQFPYNILNTNDTVHLGLGAFNTTDKYFDIEVLNPDCDVLSFEYIIGGADIDSIVVLDTAYHAIIRFNSVTGLVAVMAPDEHGLLKSSAPRAVFRVYYSSMSSNTVCLSSFIDAVNRDYEETLHRIYNGCVTITGISVLYNSPMMTVVPNPSSGEFHIKAETLSGASAKLEVMDVTGHLIQQRDVMMNADRDLIIDLSAQPLGVYLLRLTTGEVMLTQRLMKQ